MDNKLFKEKNLKETINILFLIMIISGIFGFIYETIFYRIDLGYFVKRGSTFGPWIPIYVYGGLLITICTYRFKNNPYKIFILNIFLTGFLEYITGYILLKYKKIRLWNYNTEILNFGNINGFICLRSVLFFGVSSLILIYLIIPYLLKLDDKISQKKLSIISNSLIITFFLDEFLYFLI